MFSAPENFNVREEKSYTKRLQSHFVDQMRTVRKVPVEKRHECKLWRQKFYLFHCKVLKILKQFIYENLVFGETVYSHTLFDLPLEVGPDILDLVQTPVAH